MAFSFANKQQRFTRIPSDRSMSSVNLLGSNDSAGRHSLPTQAPKPPRFKRTISQKFGLGADPRTWGTYVDIGDPEADDYLHNPTVRKGRLVDDADLSISGRGLANVGCLSLIIVAIVGLFLGFPLGNHIHDVHNQQATLGVNKTGQVPVIGNGRYSLIDTDTPQDAYRKKSWKTGDDLRLVFSDEFNTEGRTFYPGEDPYWEAVDLHYWETNNLEWYDPSAITTKDGSLVITLSEKETHGLDYQGGMLSSWNKFCFTGGYIEASVRLPGSNNVVGLWPAIWTMGNLGRAGYGASLDGLWPYSYDACDVGTAPNQTINNEPEAATTSGPEEDDYSLSYLPGQRLSRCTCPGSDHPGPMHSDGTYVGRSAPEIDMFEAQISDFSGQLSGQVSQSAQWAPFDKSYIWKNTSDNFNLADDSISELNSYRGGVLQQATSVITETNQECYQLESGCFSVYGFEYKPGYDGAYIQWVSNNKPAWTIYANGLGADSDVGISARPVSQEPMYILINLGMSNNFVEVDLAELQFPAIMLVDYIRVYQDPGSLNIGCDPADFPTQSYINAFPEAYANPNLTTWVDDYGKPFPKNKLVDGC